MEEPFMSQKTTEIINLQNPCKVDEVSFLVSTLKDIERHDFVLKGHSNKVSALDFDASSEMAASGDESGWLFLWDLREKREFFSVKLGNFKVSALIFKESKEIYASQGNLIKLINFSVETEFSELISLDSHTEQVTSLALTPDRSLLLSGSEDSTIKLWRTATNSLEQTINPSEGPIKSLFLVTSNLLSFHSNSKLLLNSLSGSFTQIEIPSTNTLSMSICSKTNELVSLSSNFLSITSLSSLTTTQTISLPEENFTKVIFSFLGNDIALLSGKSSICIYNRSKESFSYFHGHSKTVNLAQFSSDDKILLTGSLDLSLRCWNMQEKRENFAFSSHSAAVQSLCINNSDSMLASGSSDKTVKLWDLNTNKLIKSLEGHEGTVYSCKFSINDQKLATGSLDEKIMIWDLKTFEIDSVLVGHSFAVYSLEFSLNGLELFSSSRDCTVKKWNLQNKEEIFSNKCHSESVWTISLSSDGQFLATGSADKLVKVLSSKTGAELFCFEGHTNWVKAVSFSRDSEFIVSASGDQSVKVWNFQKKILAFTLNGHTGAVFSLALSNGNLHVASGAGDNYVKVWNFNERREEFTFEAHSNVINSLIFAKKSNTLFSASNDGLVKRWDLAQTPPVFLLKSHEDKVRSIKITSSQEEMISCANDGKVKVWNLKNKEVVETIQVAKTVVWALALARNDRFFITAANSGELKIFSFEDRKEIRALALHTASVNFVSISFDDCYFATCSNDRTVKIVEVDNVENVVTFFGHNHFVWVVEFTPNGKFLVSGSNDKVIKIWNIRMKRLEKDLLGHTNAVYSISISHDSRFCISGSTDTTVKLWNIEDYVETSTFTGHTDAVRSVAFSPSGKYAASASFDSYIILWNINEKRLEFKFKAHSDTLLCLKFSNDGNILYTGGSDKLIKAWKMHENNEFSELNTSLLVTYETFYHEIINFFNVLSSIRFKNFENLSLDSLSLVIGPYKFTAVHILSYLGHSNLFKMHSGNSDLLIKSDNFGHSPLFYSIYKQNQNCTDALLSHLIDLAINFPGSMSVETCFHSLRNDLISLIKNSSIFLHVLMDHFIIFNEEKIFFGSCFESTPMILLETSQYAKPEKFFIEHAENSQPLGIKSFRYQLPCVSGSASTFEMLSSLLECANQEIFRTSFVQYYARFIWNRELFWVYFYTFLVWMNLIVVVFIVAVKEKALVWALGVLNGIMIVWEVFQMAHGVSRYLASGWNMVDLMRFAFTLCWMILVCLDTYWWFIVWPTILLNIIRGLTGFRAFDKTRFYIKLILISISNSKFFLIVFIYSTICFGLLSSISSTNDHYDYRYLWVYPFELTIGDASGIGSNNFELKYVSFCLALVVNIILMLNMLISILGDSFDEFQLKSEIYDFTEIIEVLLEIEQIKSVVFRENCYYFLHICENPHKYLDQGWGGRVMFIQKEILNTKKSINEKITKFGSELNENMKVFNENFKELMNRNYFDYERIESIENRITNIEGSVNRVLEVLENKTKNLES